jgi:GDPmannose 4,6-dehydratase
MQLHYGDLEDGTSLRRIVTAVMPDGIYNLGARSHCGWLISGFTADVRALRACGCQCITT